MLVLMKFKAVFCEGLRASGYLTDAAARRALASRTSYDVGGSCMKDLLLTSKEGS